jgi:hypothetical protein
LADGADLPGAVALVDLPQDEGGLGHPGGVHLEASDPGDGEVGRLGGAEADLAVEGDDEGDLFELWGEAGEVEVKARGALLGGEAQPAAGGERVVVEDEIVVRADLALGGEHEGRDVHLRAWDLGRSPRHL